MRASRHEPQNDIDISTLPAVLGRNVKGLLIAAVAVGGLTYAGLLLVPSLYSAEAQIRIGKARGDGGRDAGESAEAAAQKIDREAIASRVQELRSPDLARKLASELHLDQKPEFNSSAGSQGVSGMLLRLVGLSSPRSGEREEERVLTSYYRALQVYQVKDTRVINIGFTARDGDLSAAVPNRLIALYQDWVRQQGVSETTDANAWLAPEIVKRARELSALEAEVDRFRSSANLFRGPGNQPTGLAEQQLADLSSELTKARGQRSEAEARARAARELIQRGSPDAIPDVQKSPVIQGLIAQRVRAEHDLTEAAVQLLPAHPRMKQLNANVLEIRRQVQREAAIIVDGLEREVKVLSLREELASRALEDAKSRVGGKADERVRLTQLEDEATAKRRELDGLRNRLEASRSRGSTKAVPVEVQVIATAHASSRPTWPNRPQMSALAAAATFVLGLVGVLFKALLMGGAATRVGLSREEELGRAAAPSNVHGEPRFAHAAAAGVASSSAVSRSGETDLDRRFDNVSDVVARLIGNSAGRNGYRLAVVGESAVTDARDEAADIAAGLSALGRPVVLVDWSLTGQGFARALGLPVSPGFNELVTGTATFDDVIRKMPDGNVFVVPSGAAVAGGMAAMQPDRINVLLDALDEAYADVIVTGTHDDVSELFLAIEGRFDAGVLVTRGRDGVTGMDGPAGRFLGFDVTDIDVLYLHSSGAKPIVRRIDPRRRGHVALAQAAGVAT